MRKLRWISLLLCLMMLLLTTTGTAEDVPKNDSPAMMGASALYEAGDLQNALALYKQEADKGNVYAMEWVAQIYARQEDYASCILYSGLAYAQGSGYAADKIGVLYKDGLGVKRDVAQALTWFERGIEKKYEGSLFHAAKVYMEEDALKDETKAASLFDQYLATEHEAFRAEALFWNAKLHYDDGVLRDDEKAAALFDRYLATDDDAYRTTALLCGGWRYYYNLDDKEKGLSMMKQAAEMGDAGGMYFYAVTLEEDENNPEEAVKWYQEAAKAGNEDAKKRLEELSEVAAGAE